MARATKRTVEDIRRDLEREREQLATAADQLRDSVGIGRKVRANLPVVAAGALGTGFLIAGGIGATARLLMRRGREGRTKARLGRFRIVD